MMKLGADEKVILIGVAADSGCGKSTFMRRLTNIFGGSNVSRLWVQPHGRVRARKRIELTDCFLCA